MMTMIIGYYFNYYQTEFYQHQQGERKDLLKSYIYG